MQQQRPNSQPIFNAPTCVISLIGILVAIYLLRLPLAIETDNWIVGLTALMPARYVGYADQLPGGVAAMITSPVTYMFVHDGLGHVIFNSLWLLIFGSAIAYRIGAVRFLMFCLATGLCGALVFVVMNWGDVVPVVGASGAVSGLLGGMLRFFFRALDLGGIHILRSAPRSVNLMSLGEALTDRRIQVMIAVWLAINLLSAFGIDGTDAGSVAWETHLGGFVAGFLSFGWFDEERPPRRKKHPHLRVVH
ncbi:MAG: rhomboid family intramembrane serine protease [Hyphomicrobiaceae bacterium]